MDKRINHLPEWDQKIIEEIKKQEYQKGYEAGLRMPESSIDVFKIQSENQHIIREIEKANKILIEVLGRRVRW